VECRRLSTYGVRFPMPGRQFAENPHYRKYEELLIELHRQFLAGQEDSPEADAVRDSMEEPEPHLTRAEIHRLKGLSGDLYLIQGEEIHERIDDPEDRLLTQHVADAVEANDWSRVLEATRRRSPKAPVGEVARIRAVAYHQLGHPLPALEFVRFAEGLEPGNGFLKFLEMELLQELGRTDEALALLRRFEATSSDDLWWLTRAVGLLLDRERTPDHESWRKVRDGLMKVLAGGAMQPEQPQSLVFDAGYGLAVTHLMLGDIEQAERALRPLEEHPVNTGERAELIRDLRLAVERSRGVVPAADAAASPVSFTRPRPSREVGVPSSPGHPGTMAQPNVWKLAVARRGSMERSLGGGTGGSRKTLVSA
jgi:tetratricopeptide (TPR) repeat protein